MAPYGFGLVVALAAWRMLPAGRPDTTVSIKDQLAGIGQVVRRPEVIVVLIAGTVSFIMVFGVFLSTLPIHLEDRFGFGASIRGLFLAIPAIPSTLVAFNVQRIRAHVDPRPLLVGCSLLFAAGFALIGSTEIAGFVVLGCIVYGAGEGALFPTLQDLSVELSPPEHRGAIVAIYVGAGAPRSDDRTTRRGSGVRRDVHLLGAAPRRRTGDRTRSHVPVRADERPLPVAAVG